MMEHTSVWAQEYRALLRCINWIHLQDIILVNLVVLGILLCITQGKNIIVTKHKWSFQHRLHLIPLILLPHMPLPTQTGMECIITDQKILDAIMYNMMMLTSLVVTGVCILKQGLRDTEQYRR
ncbi:MAG: hypothetical protein NXY57DRAFT_1031338 [Lentinula lateritia]|nr:MAG: hypothetical protein NXY57DRAFT_1031338 [Lentinula lateritia]